MNNKKLMTNELKKLIGILMNKNINFILSPNYVGYNIHSVNTEYFWELTFYNTGEITWYTNGIVPYQKNPKFNDILEWIVESNRYKLG